MASLNSFSSAGPTDDGRIKPDIVANGNSVRSLDDDSDTDTTIKSGTSMSTPGACGSALLLQEFYSDRLPNQAMRASTLKALIINTADDIGNPGPDYRFGWGLMNTEAAASLIQDHSDNQVLPLLYEGVLAQGESNGFQFRWDGVNPIRITLCWTDPAGSSTGANDSRSPRLVHDLNLRLLSPDFRFIHRPFVMPWVDNWTDSKLDANATTGTNTVDNVEQVLVAAPIYSGDYTVAINHAGNLTEGPQHYSLVITGGRLATTGYANWVLSNLSEQWDEPEEIAFSADSDGNGTPNGIEYAFNLTPGSSIDPETDLFTTELETLGDSQLFSIQYNRDTRKTDIEYQVMWSPDLEEWFPLESQIQSTTGHIETMRASVNVNDGKKFIRLAVDQL